MFVMAIFFFDRTEEPEKITLENWILMRKTVE